jgi:predicted dehydrogenase
LVVVGAVELSFPWHEMYMKEIKLFMSRAYGPGSYDLDYEQRGHDYPIAYVRWTEKRNMEEFLRLVASGQIQLQQLISHEFQLEQAARAYETVMNPASNSIAVILRYPPENSSKISSDFKPQRRVGISATNGKKEFRVALVGAGNLARWAHLPSLKRVPNAKLHAVLSTSGARGRTFASRFGASYFCSDYDEILADAESDVVLILSRNQLHFSQALAALRAGKHVFVEKPMALTEEECSELCRAVEETGKHLSVGFNRRFAPLYQEQKRYISKRVGPAVINCRVNSPAISGSYWMADPAIGGAIIGEAVHFIDLMYWLLESEPVSVSSYSLPEGSDEPIGENNLVTSLQFADGSIASLNYSTVGAKDLSGERVEVFTSGATVLVENFKRLKVSPGIAHTKSTLWPQKGYEAQLKSFFANISQGKAPEVTVKDGARSTITCVRMLESARRREPMSIDLERFDSQSKC